MNTQCIDLTGKRFNKLTVIAKGKGFYTSGGQYKTTWICKCDCGNIKEIASEKIRKGLTQSCGCVRKEKISKVNFEDLTGKKFGRLTVIRFLQPQEREDSRRPWLCQCKCGNICQVEGNKLRSGHTQSCGCIINEKIGNLNKKYQYSNKRLYSVYSQMIERCTDESNAKYKNYGGRGITVCEEWRENYDNFAEWAFNSGYDAKAKYNQCTLDRIDVNKGYSPDNCRWVSVTVQQNNRRNNVFVEHNGEKHTIAEWSRIFGVTYSKLQHGIKQGRTIAEILNI